MESSPINYARWRLCRCGSEADRFQFQSKYADCAVHLWHGSGDLEPLWQGFCFGQILELNAGTSREQRVRHEAMTEMKFFVLLTQKMFDIKVKNNTLLSKQMIVLLPAMPTVMAGRISLEIIWRPICRRTELTTDR